MVHRNKIDRTVDILLEIASEILNKKSLLKINTKRLEGLGYTKTEISYALNVLLEKNPQAFKRKKKNIDASTRILNKDEKNLFSKEAFKDILLLQAIGIIDQNDLNELIERIIIYFGKNVNQSDLRNIVNNMIGSEEIFDVDTGLRLTLRRDEKIH
ncbi:MAG: hypothetical protein A2X64_05220 [Ignavibacteria bacterium GWF2_33_9]|nr:MAG: hypothetical protein A2X64_05220 [Ignavibacteria bacterium GWF2_33_9]